MRGRVDMKMWTSMGADPDGDDDKLPYDSWGKAFSSVMCVL